MVADHAFFLTTKPINDINDVLFFGDGRKPLDTQLVVEILAQIAQETPGPPASGDTNMNVVTGERIKDDPRRDFAVRLDPHLREGWIEKRVKPFRKEAGDTSVIFGWMDDTGQFISGSIYKRKDRLLRALSRHSKCSFL